MIPIQLLLLFFSICSNVLCVEQLNLNLTLEENNENITADLLRNSNEEIEATTKTQSDTKQTLRKLVSDWTEIYLTQRDEDAPRQVHVGLYIESVGNLDETRMSFEMDVYLRLSWKTLLIRNKQRGLMHIRDKEILSKIYVPDLYFPSAKAVRFQNRPVENSALYVDHRGVVALSTRLNLVLSCQFNLRNYPMDTQLCDIPIASYAHPTDKMNVSWFSHNPIEHNSQITLAEFEITAILPQTCEDSTNFAKMESIEAEGHFGCVRARLRLSRMLSCHLVHTYVPTGLIVVISWVSFWIDRGAVPARITLSFSTLLTFTTQGAGLRFGLPKVAYAKAIDLWYGVCLFFLFGALVEFALVNSFMRGAVRYQEYASGGSKRREKSINRSYSDLTKLTGGKGVKNPSKVFAGISDQYSFRALRIDQISRILFPVAFFVFCCAYWFYYRI